MIVFLRPMVACNSPSGGPLGTFGQVISATTWCIGKPAVIGRARVGQRGEVVVHAVGYAGRLLERPWPNLAIWLWYFSQVLHWCDRQPVQLFLGAPGLRVEVLVAKTAHYAVLFFNVSVIIADL